MNLIREFLERTGPPPEKFEEEASPQFSQAHRLLRAGVRASKAGIRAVKKGDVSGVAHEKAKIQDCMQKIQDLNFVPAWLRSEFNDQVGAELMELVFFEWAYPFVFFGKELDPPDFLSAVSLGISSQARYHGIADAPGELGKAVRRFRGGQTPLEEKATLRRRLLKVSQGTLSYLTDASDERVLEITGHKKGFRRRFEGKVASIASQISRTVDELTEINGKLYEEERRRGEGG